MRRRPKFLIIGLDAADRHLVLNWSRAGKMPTLARLQAESAWGDTANPTGMVAGTVWPTFYTGVMPGRTGRFRGTTQFISGTYQHGDIEAKRFPFPAFWSVLGEAGLKCTVIDAPYAFTADDQPNVRQLVDWCSHSAWKDGTTISSPPDWAGDVVNRYGRDPVGKCDFTTLDDAHDFRRFTDGLIQRLRIKTDMMLEHLAQTDSDVVLNVYSECHCAGHQLWHVHDARHPDHDPALLAALGADPLQEVYAAMDAELERILTRVGDDTHVLVFCSHGMGPAYSGTHLLDEILLRLEGGSSPRKRQSLAQAMVSTWTRMPQWFRTLFTPLQKKLWPGMKARLVQPAKQRRRYFEIIVNDAAAGIRLNVKGREPEGRVETGREYDDICAMLTRELLEVVNPITGGPLIRRVLKTRDLYPGEKVDRLPDLIVEWNRDGPITTARGKRIGEITHRFVFRNHRTGDHTEDDGLFFLVGPGVMAGRRDGVRVQDLPPTLAALMGVEMAGTDGELVTSLLHVADEPPVAGESAA